MTDEAEFPSSGRSKRVGQAGLRFAHSPRPPRALPSAPGLIYFQVDRGSQQGEWQNVQKSLTLAIRLNENRIAGDIQGRRVLTIKTGTNQTTELQFTLYVVPQEQRSAAEGGASRLEG